ncbi:MAG: von Willebrand factor type A domain-containing protein [Vicinamibacterales bacterium]
MRLLMASTLTFVIGLMAWGNAGTMQTPNVTVPHVSGVVVDESGAVLLGATVELVSSGRVVRTTTSNGQGGFDFSSVPQGAYQVRVRLAGFTSVTQALTIGPAPPAALRLTLKVAQMSEAVRVGQQGKAADALAAPPAPSPLRVAGNAAGVAGGVVGGITYGYPAMAPPPPQGFNTESYDRIDENGYRRVAEHPLSTFSVDVDSASYANVRRFLNDGTLPPPDAVRIEELINYFHFSYPEPRGGEPFSVTTEVAVCPWNTKHRLALVGLQTQAIDTERTPPRNLVFLLDVSGSMSSSDKLPLVKTAMRMLAETLTSRDRVAIVVYAGASGLALRSTPGDRKVAIKQAIEELSAGGSTNGAEGIRLAYDTAAEHFITGGINRVILATDGDFNVGVTNQGELTRLIETERSRGIFLSVLGVGTGNLKDSTMEKLADRGNGNYAYLDSVMEARRVLIAEAGATLVTVAKDVKIQVEFNPKTVGAYRLIGYENRLLANEDFNNDKKDAGDIGAGHAVTALYEIVPPGEDLDEPSVDPLKYQPPPAVAASSSGELMTVKLRYKAPAGSTSKLMSVAVPNRVSEPSSNLGFAASVAQFGFLLRKSEHKGQTTWASARALAQRHRGTDAEGYRAEFLRLIDLASTLDRSSAGEERPRR